jgi:AcrR family transcriptional regulator
MRSTDEQSEADAATDAPKTRRKTGYHHNDLRNAVLAEAIDLIATRNGPHFSMREVAGALGVSHSSVYRHFADKEALLDALTEEAFRMLHIYQLEELAKWPDDALTRLRVLCFSYVRFAQEQRGFFRLLFDNRPDSNASRWGSYDRAAVATLIDAIRRCQDAGILIPGDPSRLAGYMVLAPHGLAHYTSQPRAPGVKSQELQSLMAVEELADLAITPLLRNPPSPEEIAARFFGDA